MAAELDFRPVPVDSGDGAALVGAMIDEMRDLYEGLDLLSPDMPKAGVAELGPPRHIPGGLPRWRGDLWRWRQTPS